MSFRERLKRFLSPATLAVAGVSALLIAAIWTAALLQLRSEQTRAFDAELAKNNNLAKLHDERAQRSFQLLDQILLLVRADHLTQEVTSSFLRDRIVAMQVDRRYVRNVSVIGPQGDLLSTLGEYRPINYADRDYFKLHAADAVDRLVIGEPIVGRLTNSWVISLTRRITLPDGRFGGVVYLALDPAFLADAYQNTEQLQNGALALIGLDGITRVRRNGDTISFGDNASASQLFKEIPKAAVGHYVGVAASDGERRLASYRVMEAYPMVTVVASSLRDLDAASLRRERVYQGVAAASTLLVMALAGLSVFTLLRRKRTLAAIEGSERRYRMLFEGSLDAVLSTHEDDRVISANPAACRLLGLAPDALGAMRLTGLFDPSDARAAQLLRQVGAEGTAHGPVRMLHADGTALEVEVSATRSPEGDHLCSMIVRDVTDRKRAEDQIKTLAFYDPLTGLPNRRLLMDRLQMALVGSNRHHRCAALLFIDLDHFKVLNDTLGHHQGDLLLQQVAQRLSACVREGDTCARLGGDEFVVMLKDLGLNPLDAANQARNVGHEILAALSQSYSLSGAHYHSSVSMGITLFGGGADEDLSEPLKRADLAMYQAKAAGRNTLRFFDPQIQAALSARATLEMHLRDAVQRQQFVLHYQPQVEGAQGRVVGVEVLVRWLHPEQGLVSPAQFIPLAEETGLILPLGQWVLQTACEQLARWAEQPSPTHLQSHLAALTVSVNVSERQFRQADFVEQVMATLERTGARASHLKLELTEGLLVTEVEDVIAKMAALQAQGVLFSLDDFGTGYSSLSYLKRLPLDQLKIDQGFVRDILVDPNDAAIARMVIVLAESLGLSVLAEGVETEAQQAMLASQGCHAYQGYLFSQPLPLADFEAWVAQQSAQK